MKRYRPIHTQKPKERYNGVFDPEHGDLELDSQIVSSTEMTGAVPAARQEPYEEDAFEEFWF